MAIGGGGPWLQHIMQFISILYIKVHPNYSIVYQNTNETASIVVTV